MAERRVLLSGWGRSAPTASDVLRPRSVDEVADLVRAAGPRGVLARGLGRSYGDAAQNAGGLVLDLRGLDAIGTVDPSTCELTCGAGTSLDALLRRSLPQGWFVPVTPGTRQVTLGGAVAADVHGKNHHRDGTLGRHVSRLEIIDGRGEVRTLTRGDELFQASLGGMGLTGVLTSVTLRMIAVQSAWMGVDTWRTAGLEDTMASLADSDTRHRYSVAWIDCLARGAALGRGVVSAAEHLTASQLNGPAADDPLRFAPRRAVAAPPWAPVGLLASSQVAAFNEAYYRRAPTRGRDVTTHLATFFHPLDGVSGWNRLYGRTGFVQYQFVSPHAQTVASVLGRLQTARVPALLAVLKRFGPGSNAPLSFPRAGWTLAVDIPARIRGLGAVLDAADREVVAAGGRVYLAKDARLMPDLLNAMYPDLDRWRAARAAADPHRLFSSDLSRRLHL